MGPTIRTPPVWLRHITPWWLLHWINEHYCCCWAMMVTWKMCGSDSSWSVDPTCLTDWGGEPPVSMCYCGKYERGVATGDALMRHGQMGTLKWAESDGD